MEAQQLKKIIQATCRGVEKNDKELLERDVSEWAITHRLALYLTRNLSLDQRFSKYFVDCEYNKMLEPNGHNYVAKHGDSSKLIRPDIIVHDRGNNNKNLLVIELKKIKYFNTMKFCKIDMRKEKVYDNLCEKLNEYSGVLAYRYACIIGIGKNDLSIRLFRVLN